MRILDTRRQVSHQEASRTVAEPVLDRWPDPTRAPQLSEPSKSWITRVPTDSSLNLSTSPSLSPLLASALTPPLGIKGYTSFGLREASPDSSSHKAVQNGGGDVVHDETEELPIPRIAKGFDFVSEAKGTHSLSMWSASSGLRSVVNGLSSCSTLHKDDVVDAIGVSCKSSSTSRHQTSICSLAFNSSRKRGYTDYTTSKAPVRSRKGKCKLPGAFMANVKPYVPRRHFLALDITWSDRFDNTTLHVAAALEPTYVILEDLIDRGVDINAVNTAGQTFMHVLNPDLNHADIRKLLSMIHRRGFDFDVTDHLGQTIFHELIRWNPDLLRRLAMPPWIHDHLWQRDSSRRNLKDDVPSATISIEISTKIFWKSFDATTDIVDSLIPHTEIPQRADLPHITQMIKCIREADRDCTKLDDKMDVYGRNALHLLADTQFDPRTTAGKDGVEGFKHVCRLRRRCADALLSYGESSAQILNVYDVSGRTPLMALIGALHIADEELEYLVELLIRRGASIDHRNGDGESPLHIATRLGRIAVTRVLLKHGANLNATRADGQSITVAGVKCAARAKEDLVLHGRIMACVCLLADDGALLEPTFFDEWDRRPNDGSKSREQYDRTRSEIYTKCE